MTEKQQRRCSLPHVAIFAAHAHAARREGAATEAAPGPSALFALGGPSGLLGLDSGLCAHKGASGRAFARARRPQDHAEVAH